MEELFTEVPNYFIGPGLWGRIFILDVAYISRKFASGSRLSPLENEEISTPPCGVLIEIYILYENWSTETFRKSGSKKRGVCYASHYRQPYSGVKDYELKGMVTGSSPGDCFPGDSVRQIREFLIQQDDLPLLIKGYPAIDLPWQGW